MVVFAALGHFEFENDPVQYQVCCAATMCINHSLVQMVPDNTRTYSFQSGDSASSDCYLLKHILQVCDSAVSCNTPANCHHLGEGTVHHLVAI